MKIITAGSSYLDIDAYAGIIAYAELLQKQGFEAQAVSTAVPNESVTKTVRSWPVSLKTEYKPGPDDTFTLIDVSTPEHFDKFVDHDRIESVIDHHPGYERYWQERIGKGANIEPIGAACTQVYECWKQAGLIDEISETSARLLVCGILDNTLNFGAKINTKRDEVAYADLMNRAELPTDWPAKYFGECQAAIDKDPVRSIQKDTKNIYFTSIGHPINVGQFAVWSASEIISKFRDELHEAFDTKDRPWFINIISIDEGKSYFMCSESKLQKWLAELLGIEFDGPLAVADRLWLRKEIIGEAIGSSGSVQ